MNWSFILFTLKKCFLMKILKDNKIEKEEFLNGNERIIFKGVYDKLSLWDGKKEIQRQSDIVY